METQTEITEGFGLSPQQRRLWSLGAGEGGGAYRARGVLLVEGELRAERLAEALRAVVARHEILRTNFRRLPEMTIPVQVIGGEGLSFEGPRGLPGAGASGEAEAVEALLREEARRPFDAGADAPLRAALFALAPRRHLLLLSLPALCADAATLRNLTREVARAYADPHEEPGDEPMQYADVAEWQNGLLEDEYSAPGREYWRGQDLSALLDLRLPFERRPGDAADREPESLSFEVAPESWAALQQFAREHETTPELFLLACWQTLLWRHTRRPEVGVGVLFAGRNYPELEGALGPLARHLPVVCRLSEGTRFEEVLAQVTQAAAAADKWQECFSWEHLARPEGGEGRAPFFPYCFEFEQQSVPEEAGGVRMSLALARARLDRCRLSLSLSSSPSSLRASLLFDPSSFSAASAAALADQFRTLLRSALDSPSSQAALLRSLSPEAEAALLSLSSAPTPSAAADNDNADDNDAATVPAAAQFLHRRFERQAAAHPDRTALVCGSVSLSYAELNERANRLARLLRSRGAGPEGVVALLVGRGPEAIVSLLAAWKAGGAYLPLEPTLPAARLRLMLCDSGARLLVAGGGMRQLAESLLAPGEEGDAPGAAEGEELADSGIAGPRPAPPQLVALDQEETARLLSTLDCSDLPPDGLLPANLSYVLFTSGSTGRPKAVAVEHRQVSNYVAAVEQRLGLPAGSSFASVSTLAADLGHTALFPALCGGGTLHLVGQEEAGDGAALSRYMAAHGVDCLKVVPTHLRALLEGGVEGGGGDEGGGVLPRRVLVLGGEASTWGLVREAVRRGAEGLRVLNHYGPTEATVGALTYEAAPAAEAAWAGGPSPSPEGWVPLGYALGGVRAYVLDGQMRPAAAGETGEVYLGGAGVARGYVGRAGQTAERFVPDVVSGEAGARLYRTGDRGRYGAGWEVEFGGRADGQVKVRGYRVELGEVEAAVRGHAGVRECAVVALGGGEGVGARLACYYAGEGVGSEEVREWLEGRLPEYMVPWAVVEVRGLPRTANGKVDLKALPAPDEARPKVEYVPPRGETEGALVSAWESVLGVSPVGIHDNYFALGGDSIRVIQIVAEAAKYGLKVTALDVLQYPTVHELARHARAGEGAAPGGGRVPLELARLPEQVVAGLPEGFEEEFEDAYPLARMQEFVIHHYAHDRQGAGVYHIQHAYHVYDEGMSLEAFKRALAMLVAKHPALRTTFLTGDDGRLFQAVRRRADFHVGEEDIRHLAPAEQDEYVEAASLRDRAEPFDPARPDLPLYRFRLFIRSDRSFEFFMSIHHALTDGWGDRELTNELVALYAALKRGEATAPGPAVNSYKEFVALEREIVAGEEARGFWREHLRGHRHEPPPSAAREDEEAAGGYSHVLESELAARLQSLSRGRRVSLKAVFLSAYLDLIGAEAGSAAPTVGVVSNGRSERLSAPLKSLGLFWNIVPFHCALGRDKGEQLGRVQQRLIEAERYARYPLAQILEDEGRPELFFATLNFLHFHNLKEVTGESGLRLLGLRGHDKFHFPLNYVVSVNPFSGTIGFRVEYDRRHFGGRDVRRMTDDFVERLGRLADAG